jgi:hypothetical protein
MINSNPGLDISAYVQTSAKMVTRYSSLWSSALKFHCMAEGGVDLVDSKIRADSAQGYWGSPAAPCRLDVTVAYDLRIAYACH